MKLNFNYDIVMHDLMIIGVSAFFFTRPLIVPGHLGYSPHGGEGWCSLKIYDDTHKLNVLVVVLANDLWIYLTFFTVTILYLSTHCYIKFKVHTVHVYLLVSTALILHWSTNYRVEMTIIQCMCMLCNCLVCLDIYWSPVYYTGISE